MSNDVSLKLSSLTPYHARLLLVDTLMGGTDAMRVASKKYLPQFYLESDDDYKKRLNASTLYPAYSETVATMVGRVFSKSVSPNEDVPKDVLDRVVPDMDGEGRNLHVFCEEWFTHALNHGVAFCLVDTPVKGADITTRAQEIELGFRPNCTIIKYPQLLGWKLKNRKLLQFRYQEIVQEDDGEFGSKDIEQIRVLEVGVTKIYRQKTKGKKEWVLFQEIKTDFNEIPIVPLYTNRKGYMLAEPPLYELAHLNVKHWQQQSDKDSVLHTACVPILLRIGQQKSFDAEGKEQVIEIGKSVIDLPIGGNLTYVEHTGAAVATAKTSLEELEDQMKASGAKLLTKTVLALSDSHAKSEEQKEISQLASMANALEDAIGQVLDLIGFAIDRKYAKKGGRVTVNANLDPAYVGMSSADISIYLSSGIISQETAFSIIKRKGEVPDDLTWESEQERINANSMSIIKPIGGKDESA